MEELFDIMEKVNLEIKQYISKNMRECTAEELGLDPRAGYKLFVNEFGIAVHNSARSTLDYYGGFEYVDSEYVQTIGNWTFYLEECDRVSDCIFEYFNYETD